MTTGGQIEVVDKNTGEREITLVNQSKRKISAKCTTPETEFQTGILKLKLISKVLTMGMTR